MTRTDIQLKEGIEQELQWDSRVTSTGIGVSVDDGSVSLLGAVDTYLEKWAAEEVAKRVSGVSALAQGVSVKILDRHARSDVEIVAAVENALKWNVYIPPTVTVAVQDGQVVLAGHVAANRQRDSAEQAIRHVAGIVSIRNTIVVNR